MLLATVLLLGARNLRAFVRSMSPLAPWLLYTSLLFLAYPLYILAWWFFYRYYLPIAAVLLLAIGLVAAFFLRLERVRAIGAPASGTVDISPDDERAGSCASTSARRPAMAFRTKNREYSSLNS